MKNKDLKISKESVDKIFTPKVIDTSKYVEVTEDMLAESSISLTDLIVDAYKAALKNDIRANTVMISKRLAKVNGFVNFFGDSYADFPPLICGLEAYVTDEMPEEFAFGLVEAPTTQREQVFEDGRKTGYKEGYKEGAREIFEEIEEAIMQSNEISDIRMRELAPHTYKVMREAGKLYYTAIVRAVAELKKKYAESEKDK